MRKYAELRLGQPALVERHPILEPLLEFLSELQDEHFEVWGHLVAPADVKPGQQVPMYATDLVVTSILNRSLDLTEGFLTTFNRWNLATAAPVVRIQLDNLLRLTLLAIHPSEALVDALLGESRLDKLVDPLAPPGSKVKLTDKRLREHASEHHPWINDAYESTSQWVHFSHHHYQATFRDRGDEVDVAIPTSIDGYKLEFLVSLLDSMCRATYSIIELARSFGDAKWKAVAREDSRPV